MVIHILEVINGGTEILFDSPNDVALKTLRLRIWQNMRFQSRSLTKTKWTENGLMCN